MKKFLGIVVLGLLLIINVAQAKTIDAGNGITLDIPTNYKYFEIKIIGYISVLSTRVYKINILKYIRQCIHQRSCWEKFYTMRAYYLFKSKK